MSKILIITNHSYMLWQFRRELIAKLAETNEVVLCMPFVGHVDNFRAMGLRCIETKIDRRGINPVTDLGLMSAYRRILADERPELVITYSIKPNIYAGLMCAQLGIPFCANVQGLGTAFEKPVLAQFVAMLYRLSFRHVRTAFFENSENAAEFRKRHIVPAEKQKLLKGAGINLEDYPYQPYPKHDRVHFLYLGRLMKEKGMDELFDAAERLRQDGEEFFLDLVGFYEDAYREKVARLEAEGIAKFHGFQENPCPWYAAADCVVLPSYHEGMSNVLLEAAATGRPLITTDIPGCREAVDDGKTGLLVTPKDPDSLCLAMKRFLSLDEEQREKMGRLGRGKMEREFPKDAVVTETIRALGLPEEPDNRKDDGEDQMTDNRENDMEYAPAHKLTEKQKKYLPVKRAADLVIAGAACAVLAPVMGALAIAIKLDSPGPVLFKQKRIGKDKKIFEIWKFRTMRTDAPKDVPTHLLQHSDAYITRVGRFLRKYSLDELPQFLQVLFGGDISIVGPRPALWNQDDLIAERDRYGANSVKPGITGWAQVNGRDELEVKTKARFDGEYVKKMGPWMDLKCFLATIGAVLYHDGVVEGGTGEMHRRDNECSDRLYKKGNGYAGELHKEGNGFTDRLHKERDIDTHGLHKEGNGNIDRLEKGSTGSSEGMNKGGNAGENESNVVSPEKLKKEIWTGLAFLAASLVAMAGAAVAIVRLRRREK